MIFRKLTPQEEQEFRDWTRANYSDAQVPNALWHPVVRDEWAKIAQERVAAELAETTASRSAAP